jgi:hypothetical protein
VPGTTPVALRRFIRADCEPEWASPWVESGFPVAEAVASWRAHVPDGSMLSVLVQARAGARESDWFELGRWTEGPGRTSVPGQLDLLGRVDVDTVVAAEPFDAVRVRTELAGPGEVYAVSLCLSGEPGAAEIPSELALAACELDVPALSQHDYDGVLPELDGGGESWCSPTSLAMVLGFWGVTVDGDPVVAAARGTYDVAYGGCGNWSFNVAYAARFGLDGFVTRLASLAEAEVLLAAGIPLVLSIRVEPGALAGFPLARGTAGHLIVLRGMTGGGDAIVNDPAARDEVRRVYARAELERAWLGGSGGIAYVMRPGELSLPEGSSAW